MSAFFAILNSSGSAHQLHPQFLSKMVEIPMLNLKSNSPVKIVKGIEYLEKCAEAKALLPLTHSTVPDPNASTFTWLFPSGKKKKNIVSKIFTFLLCVFFHFLGCLIVVATDLLLSEMNLFPTLLAGLKVWILCFPRSSKCRQWSIF